MWAASLALLTFKYGCKVYSQKPWMNEFKVEFQFVHAFTFSLSMKFNGINCNMKKVGSEEKLEKPEIGIYENQDKILI